MTQKKFELTVRDYIEEPGKRLPDFKITHEAQLADSEAKIMSPVDY
ncbi:hypothetical protein [Mucilaginibacter sp. OK098]|nr:hypothetical protein [Mucilaginibacter sp. OK098]